MTNPIPVEGQEAHPDDRGVPPGARGVRLSECPMLSVVVASRGSRAQLEACLASLVPLCRSGGVETVIVRAGNAGDVAALSTTLPELRIVFAPPGSSMQQLRAVGMNVVGGDIVALVEDDGPVDPDRIAALVRAQRGA